MKISHGTYLADQSTMNGYGYATEQMLASLRRLGHEVSKNDPTADVEIWFDQPHHWKFSKGPYKIGYHPWESTKLKPGWVKIMNQCDEVWTPSPLIAKWYAADGVTVPVHVYEHGVDKIWTPKKRVVEDTFNFLHVGMEAARKGGSETMQAFRLAFYKTPDARLTMKTIRSGWKISQVGRIHILDAPLGIDELVDLFHNHHAYVYPSAGEGFGLTPIQAMSTGMPVITVPAWAPYERFLDPKLGLPSKLALTPWSKSTHPGKMFRPTVSDLVDRMRYVYNNYDETHARALDNVDRIQSEYDWDFVTKTAMDALEERLGKL